MSDASFMYYLDLCIAYHFVELLRMPRGTDNADLLSVKRN